MEADERIQYAIEHTEVVRSPQQSLATFGTSNIYYYLLTEPVYSELMDNVNETVIREGRVRAERPRIVTPFYLVNLFEGFQHGREYVQFLLRAYGPHEPGLLYRYKNEPKETSIVSHPLPEIAQRLNEMLAKVASLKSAQDYIVLSVARGTQDRQKRIAA